MMNTKHHTPMWLPAIYNVDELSVLNRPHPIFGLGALHPPAAGPTWNCHDRRGRDWSELARRTYRRVAALLRVAELPSTVTVTKGLLWRVFKADH
jgi:hypothetical protein